MQLKSVAVVLLSLLSNFSLFAQGFGLDWAINNRSSLLSQGSHAAAEGNQCVAARVHPHLSEGQFKVALGQIENVAEFSLSTMKGPMRQRQTLQAVQRFDLWVPEAAGVYFLDVKDEQGDVSRHQLLKYEAISAIES